MREMTREMRANRELILQQQESVHEVAITSLALCCPSCGGDLNVQDETLACELCGATYQISNGVPVLLQEPSIALKEFSKQELGKLIVDAKADLESAVHAWLRSTDAPPRFGEQMLSMARTGWQFLLPFHEGAAVLDLGAGWGTRAYSLATLGGQVVALDPVLERMQFLRLRSEKDSFSNLHPICAGDGPLLPFSSSVFDVVILGGYLAHVPEYLPGNPLQVQKQLLREVVRVLKPEGCLFLGIETKYAWTTWFRNPDSYTGLRFVTWLPRWLAHAYTRLKGKGSYRNYLHSKQQLEQLLSSCGFSNRAAYLPMPRRYFPSAMIPAEDKYRVARQAKRVVVGRRKKIVQWMKGKLTASFPDAYCLVASRQDESSFLDRLTGHLQKEYNLDAPSSFHYRMNSEMGMVTIIFEEKEAPSPFVLKLPIHARAEAELQQEVDLLTRVRTDTHVLSPLAQLCANVLGYGFFGRQYYAVFSLLPGVSGDKIKTRHGQVSVLQQGIDLAAKLFMYKRGTPYNPDFEKHLRVLQSKVGSLAYSPSQVLVVEQAASLVEEMWGKMDNTWLSIGHGDYKLANLLFDPETYEVTGVIDWGANLEHDLLGYDAQFLVVDYQSRQKGQSLPRVMRSWLHEEATDPLAVSLLDRFSKQTGLPSSTTFWRGMAAYQWLQRLAPLAGPYETQRFNHHYVDEMFSVFE